MSLVLITDSDLGDGSIERESLPRHDVAFAAGHPHPERAEGLLVQWARVDDDLLDRFPDVRAVVRYGIGLDNVDQDATARRGIRVANVPDYCIDEVAAHAVSFIAARSRRLLDYRATVLDGRWTVDDVPAPRAPENDPVGLAGLGRIGLQVAARAAALGHPVLAWDPYLTAWPEGITRIPSLDELAAASGHLSLHIPLGDATRGIIGTTILDALGPDGHLVNTSRGGLVDEQALLASLDDGRLGFASLDVLATEPPTGDSLTITRHPRALVTPHAAYNSDSARLRLQRRAAEILGELLDAR